MSACRGRECGKAGKPNSSSLSLVRTPLGRRLQVARSPSTPQYSRKSRSCRSHKGNTYSQQRVTTGSACHALQQDRAQGRALLSAVDDLAVVVRVECIDLRWQSCIAARATAGAWHSTTGPMGKPQGWCQRCCPLTCTSDWKCTYTLARNRSGYACSSCLSAYKNVSSTCRGGQYGAARETPCGSDDQSRSMSAVGMMLIDGCTPASGSSARATPAATYTAGGWNKQGLRATPVPRQMHKRSRRSL